MFLLFYNKYLMMPWVLKLFNGFWSHTMDMDNGGKHFLKTV